MARRCLEKKTTCRIIWHNPLAHASLLYAGDALLTFFFPFFFSFFFLFFSSSCCGLLRGPVDNARPVAARANSLCFKSQG